MAARAAAALLERRDRRVPARRAAVARRRRARVLHDRRGAAAQSRLRARRARRGRGRAARRARRARAARRAARRRARSCAECFVARAPGKLVALGEYAVLDGAPALVLAVDRYAAGHRRPRAADGAVPAHDCVRPSRASGASRPASRAARRSSTRHGGRRAARSPGVARSTRGRSSPGPTKLGIGLERRRRCARGPAPGPRIRAQRGPPFAELDARRR